MALMVRAVSRLVLSGECFSLRKLSNFLFRLAVYGSPLVPVVRLVPLEGMLVKFYQASSFLTNRT